jgi:TPR repeat protein
MRLSGRTAIAFAVLTLLALSACGGGPQRERNADLTITGVDGRVTVIRPGQDPNRAYTEGLDLKNQGNCARAIEILRPVANLGPGYENAQTALGMCLLQAKPADKDLSSDSADGLTWLQRAADAGWPEAQGELAAAYAFGPAATRNGNEAAYWLALYQNNPGRQRIGFAPMPAADVASIEKLLTSAQKEAGAQRAAMWERKVWLPPASAQAPGALGPGRGPRRR